MGRIDDLTRIRLAAGRMKVLSVLGVSALADELGAVRDAVAATRARGETTADAVRRGQTALVDLEDLRTAVVVVAPEAAAALAAHVKNLADARKAAATEAAAERSTQLRDASDARARGGAT